MRKIVIAHLLSTSAPLSSIYAQHMNEPDSPCAGVAVTSDLTSCLSKAEESAAAQLNALYTKLRKSLDSPDRKRLVTAERLWVQYRDANCSAEQELDGDGTGRYPAYYGRLEAMTRTRIEELKITYAVKLKGGTFKLSTYRRPH